MEMIDYSKIGKKTLEDSGLLSSNSLELRKILALYKVRTIVDFLKLMDSNDFKGYKYKETLMEAIGLSNLLKQEYLNIPISMNINFASTIKYMFFEEVSVWLYGIKTMDNKKINIYSLMISLGFNDYERSRILRVEEDFLEDTPLIDLIYDAYVRCAKYGVNSKDNQIMCKKLLIILKHYLIYYKEDTVSNFMREFYTGMEQFNDLLTMRNDSNNFKKR